MAQRAEQVAPIKGLSGWVGAGLLALGFVGLYLVNYIVPLTNTNYTTRIWDWTELALTVMALIVIAFHWRLIRVRTIWIGATLGLISGWSYLLDDASLRGAVT